MAIPGAKRCARKGIGNWSTSFVPATPLEDGEHTITVSGTDLAGRSGSSEPEAFVVDTTAPSASISKHPKKVVRTTKKKVKLTFRFAADRFIPRFRLEGVEVGHRKNGPATGKPLRLIATATVGDGGLVDLSEPIIVRAGEAFVAVPDPVSAPEG